MLFYYEITPLSKNNNNKKKKHYSFKTNTEVEFDPNVSQEDQ